MAKVWNTSHRFTNLVMLACSILVGLALAELIVGMIIPIRDLGPSLTLYDPFLGKRLKSNFSTVRRTPEFSMRFSTTAFGFRGAPTIELRKGSILFLGDSFTMGYGVNDGEEYPAIIDAHLQQSLGAAAPAVINAGIGDSGNGRWIKLLSTLAEEVEPRLVVMQVLDNDFSDNVTEGLFIRDGDHGLQELPIPPPGLGRGLQLFIEAVPGLASTNLVGLLRQVRWPRVASSPTPSELPPGKLQPDHGLTLLLVEKAIQICRQNGWKALGLIVGLEGEQKVAVMELFQVNRVEIMSVPSKTERPDLYYKIDGHWNAAGHIYAADLLLPVIKRMVGLAE